MPRHTSIEGVFGESIGAGQQAKTGARHDEVLKSRHRADRAVAVVHEQAGGGVDLEADGPAMAAAAVGDEIRLRGVHAATLHHVTDGVRQSWLSLSSSTNHSAIELNNTRAATSIGFSCLRKGVLVCWKVWSNVGIRTVIRVPKCFGRAGSGIDTDPCRRVGGTYVPSVQPLERQFFAPSSMLDARRLRVIRRPAPSARSGCDVAVCGRIRSRRELDRCDRPQSQASTRLASARAAAARMRLRFVPSRNFR